MMRTGLTAMVKEAAAAFTGPFTSGRLADAAGVQTYADRDKVYSKVIPALLAQGVLKREGGFLHFVPQQKPRTRLEVVWHLVRSHRQFNVDEIERMSGFNRHTVKNLLNKWTALGYLRRSGRAKYQLVRDPGPQAPNALNTKLKRLKGPA